MMIFFMNLSFIFCNLIVENRIDQDLEILKSMKVNNKTISASEKDTNSLKFFEEPFIKDSEMTKTFLNVNNENYKQITQPEKPTKPKSPKTPKKEPKFEKPAKPNKNFTQEKDEEKNLFKDLITNFSNETTASETGTTQSETETTQTETTTTASETGTTQSETTTTSSETGTTQSATATSQSALQLQQPESTRKQTNDLVKEITEKTDKLQEGIQALSNLAQDVYRKDPNVQTRTLSVQVQNFYIIALQLKLYLDRLNYETQ